MIFLTLVSFFSFPLAHTFTPSIAPVPGQPFATGYYPNGIAYSPNGKWLSNVSGQSPFTSPILSSFSVNTDGSLSQIAESPLNIRYPLSATYSPDSRFASVCGAIASEIDIFSINQSGEPSLSSSWDTGGYNIYQTTYSPSGEFLAAASGLGITMLRVDGTTGALTFLNTFTPSGNVLLTSDTVQIIAFSPDGRFLAGAWVTSFGNSEVVIFSVDQSGNLSNEQNFPITTATTLSALAYSPDGNFLAIVDYGNTITMCAVDSSTGSLSVIEQVPTQDGQGSQTVAFSSDSQFVVQTNNLGGNVGNMYVYSVGQTGHLTQFGAPLPTGTNPRTITVFSPINHDGIALCSTANQGSNDITSYAFSLCSPVATAPTITSPANGSSFAAETSVLLSGTLSNGNSLMLSSSNSAIAAIGSVSITATNWTAPLTMLAHGSVTITATATNCAGNAATTDATYTVTASGVSENGFSLNLFEALHAKYFLE